MRFSHLPLIAIWLLIFVLASVALAQPADAGRLVGTQWRLVSYGAPNAETPVIATSNVTLNFASDNRVEGNGGCNGYSGSYTIDGSTIAFNEIVSTLMACADDAVTRQEGTYFAALRSATRYERSGNQLTIWYDDGQRRLNFVSSQGAAQNPEYENLTSPVDLLASYYNAINRQEYERAYSYWQSPPLAYDEFIRGFAETLSAQVIVQPPTRIGVAAGSQYVEIPTVLIADHQDGTQHTFAGCFVTRKSNLQPPDIPEEDVWHLYDADLEEVTDGTAVPTLLAQACGSS